MQALGLVDSSTSVTAAILPFLRSVGQVAYGSALYSLKSAKIAAGSSGDNTVVAAVTSKQIIVLGFDLAVDGAVNCKWKDGASTDMTGAFVLAAAGARWNQGVGEYPLFATTAGNALVLNNSAAQAANGFVVYITV